MGPHEPRNVTVIPGTAAASGGPEQRNIPAQESRGGNRVDWQHAEPGEPLPELPPDAYPEPDSEQLPFWDEDDRELGGEG